MKTKHVITIGILSAIAVALLGIAVALGKVNKPKTLQTNAYDTITQYNYSTNSWTVYGEPETYALQDQGVQGYENYGNNLAVGDYRIEKINNTYRCRIQTRGIISQEFETIPWQMVETEVRLILNRNDTLNKIYIYESATSYWSTIDDNCYWDFTWQFYFLYTSNNHETVTITLTYSNQSVTQRDDLYPFDQVNNYIFDVVDMRQTLETLHNTYQTGYTTAGQQQQIVPIRNLMLEILTMPFTFITQAFDVTLWEGTIYAVNIGNFIKGIIAILAIIFIIKLFTSGLSILGNYVPDVKNKKQRSKTTVAQKTNVKIMKRHDTKVEKKINDGFRRG